MKTTLKHIGTKCLKMYVNSTDHTIRFIILFVFLICVNTSTFAQEYLWHKHLSGSGVNNVTGLDIAMDASGYTYVVGVFGGTVDFGGQTLTSNSPSGDIFYAKYNSAGVIFVRKIGAPLATCAATGLALFKDASNNIFLYMSGYFNSVNGTIVTVDFNPSGPGGELTTNDIYGDAFVAKYNTTNGSYVWATRVANSSADFANGGKVATDASGNLYMSSTNGGSGALLRKFTASAGTQVFANNIGYNASASANGIAFNAGNIYVCGFALSSFARPIVWFNTNGTLVGKTGAPDRSFQNIAFDNSTGIYGVGGIVDFNQDDVVIEKYTTTTSSTPVWNKFFNSGIYGSSIDIAYGGSSSGDLMVTGWFRGTVNFNSPGAYANTLTSSGNGADDNIFVARYYTSSGSTEWVKNNTSSTSSGQSAPIALAASQKTVVVLSSISHRTVNASFCGTAQNINSDNGDNSFIAAYSQKLFAPAISGPTNTLPGEPEDYSISPLPGANTYQWVVPPGWTIVSYGTGNQYIYTNVGNSSGNVQSAAIYDCGTSAVTNLYVTVGSGGGHLASVYPNPASQTLNIDVENLVSPVSIALLDGSGSVLTSTSYDPANPELDGVILDVSAVPSGLYYVHIKSQDKVIKEQISISH